MSPCKTLMIGDSISNQHPTSFPLRTVPAGKDGNIKSPKVAEVHIHIVCMYRYVYTYKDRYTDIRNHKNIHTITFIEIW